VRLVAKGPPLGCVGTTSSSTSPSSLIHTSSGLTFAGSITLQHSAPQLATHEQQGSCCGNLPDAMWSSDMRTLPPKRTGGPLPRGYSSGSRRIPVSCALELDMQLLSMPQLPPCSDAMMQQLLQNEEKLMQLHNEVHEPLAPPVDVKECCKTSECTCKCFNKC
jgi:hypothetical protein